VGAHVGEQVVDGPAQQFLVPGGHEAGGDLRPPRPLRVGDLGPFGTSVDQGGEIDQVVLLVGMLVEPRQPEHVVDQPAHALGFQRDAAHRLVDLRAQGEGTLLVELGVGAQRRQRGAQLVAGVGEEAPGELLAGLTVVDDGLDAGQHPVESRAQPAHLGGRIVRADPVGEVTGGDAVGLGRHRLDRTQAAAHDPGDAHGHEQPGHRRADDEDELEPADGAVDGGEAGGGDQGAGGRGYPDGPQAELGGPAHAGHGLDVRAHHGDRPSGWELRNKAWVAHDESPPPVDGHEPDVVLGQYRWRHPQPRPGDHPVGSDLGGHRQAFARAGGRQRRRLARHCHLQRPVHRPVQAEDGLQPRVGLAEQVPAQRGDRGDVEGDQRNYRDQQDAGQDAGAQLGPAGPSERHRGSLG
jgi:hypothetical protein